MASQEPTEPCPTHRRRPGQRARPSEPRPDRHRRARARRLHALLPPPRPDLAQVHHRLRLKGPRSLSLPYSQPTAGGLDRADAKPGDGRPGGSDLPLLRAQLLDEYDVDHAILTGWLNASADAGGLGREFKTAPDVGLQRLADRGPGSPATTAASRVRSRSVAHDPEGAVARSSASAKHPQIVQVILRRGDRPYGEPRYRPIFEAAERNGLVVAIHHREKSPDRARAASQLRRVAHGGGADGTCHRVSV